jgi:D-aspartate ligase
LGVQFGTFPHAIVLGLDNITGLQTARILARRGVPVIGMARDRGHFCSRTRVCKRILFVDHESEAAIRELEELGPDLPEKAVLIPTTDLSVLLVSHHRDRLSRWYHVLLPRHDVIELLMDKASFLKHAQDNGIQIPKTFFLKDRTDAETAARNLRYPVVVKPPLKTSEWQEQQLAKVYRAKGREELLRLYEHLAPSSDQLIAQEWIEGGDSRLYSCNCYFGWDSTPLVTFVARKLRQWPPGTGTSSLGEECRNDAILMETIRLFETVGFQGLGYVEMKRDERSGEHYIIEANVGRPTARAPIAEAGGVELLFTMFSDAVGLPLPRNRNQRYTGVKWLYLRHDLQSALHSFVRRELTLSEWRDSWRGRKAFAVWDRRDPLPFFVDFINAAARVARITSRLRRRRMRRG